MTALRRLAWRVAPWAGALAVVIVLAGAQAALADSDLFGNVAPESQVPDGGLAERYPLSHYQLDQHFEAVDASLTGGVDVSGVPPLIAYFLANALWQLTAFLANALITLFTFAFSLDLVSGSEATGGAGALAPVSDAVRTIYSDVFGAPWLAVAIVLTGLWAMWKALVQRRYAETAGALGLSVVFVVIALAFVTQPERTIGEASGWSNDMSAAFLSLSREGDVESEEEAKGAASDQLFQLLVYQPWVVLNFGGVEHCVTPTAEALVDEADPRSVPVRPLASDPARDRELRRELAGGTDIDAEGKLCVNNQNKYAAHFLRYAPGSDERDDEYEALNEGDTGKLPDSDPAKDSEDYRLSFVDKPATDAMEKDGQYQRLLMALVIFLGELGAFLLLGSLSVAVILAQVLVLLLLAFAPVALVVGVFPGRGHDFFRGWLMRLAAFLLRKAIYSLILAVLLAVAAALQAASANLGWLLSFGLQALFFWAVFIYRKELAGQLTTATAGPGADREGAAGRLAALYYARQLTRGPARALRRGSHALGGQSPRPGGAAMQAPSVTAATTPTQVAPEPAPPATEGTRPEQASGEAPGATGQPGPSGSEQATTSDPKPPQQRQGAGERVPRLERQRPPRGRTKAPGEATTGRARPNFPPSGQTPQPGGQHHDPADAGPARSGQTAPPQRPPERASNPLVEDLRRDEERLGGERQPRPADVGVTPRKPQPPPERGEAGPSRVPDPPPRRPSEPGRRGE